MTGALPGVGLPNNRHVTRDGFTQTKWVNPKEPLFYSGFTHSGDLKPDYRGELKVLLINHGADPFPIKRGDRIAQLVVAPVQLASFVEVDMLDDTVRGMGGFGSTGV